MTTKSFTLIKNTPPPEETTYYVPCVCSVCGTMEMIHYKENKPQEIAGCYFCSQSVA